MTFRDCIINFIQINNINHHFNKQQRTNLERRDNGNVNSSEFINVSSVSQNFASILVLKNVKVY